MSICKSVARRLQLRDGTRQTRRPGGGPRQSHAGRRRTRERFSVFRQSAIARFVVAGQIARPGSRRSATRHSGSSSSAPDRCNCRVLECATGPQASTRRRASRTRCWGSARALSGSRPRRPANPWSSIRHISQYSHSLGDRGIEVERALAASRAESSACRGGRDSARRSPSRTRANAPCAAAKSAPCRIASSNHASDC